MIRSLALFAGGCAAVSPPYGIEATASRSTWIDHVLHVSWSGPPGEAWVAYGPVDEGVAPEQALTRQTTPVPTGGEVRIPLVELVAGQTNAWRAFVRGDDGTVHESALGMIDVAGPDVDFTLLETSEGSEVADGYVVTNLLHEGRSWAVAIDGGGRIVWWQEESSSEQKIVRARPTLDGQGIAWATNEASREVDDGWIVRQSLDGERRTETRAEWVHHDFLEEPDGSWSFLGHVFDDVPSVTRPWFEYAVATDAVRLAPEGTPRLEDVEQRFDFLEDYPVEPWTVCEHMTSGVFVRDADEWTHANSLLPAPDGDGWLVMSRYLDALVRVGADGTFRWQLGGRDGEFTTADGQPPFLHAHTSQAWDDRVLVFDNGTHGPEPVVSRVVELRYDEEERTVETVWEMVDPEGDYTPYLGDAARLPSGNTLIAWSPRGDLMEVDPSGRIVWRAATEAVIGRVTWVPSLVP